MTILTHEEVKQKIIRLAYQMLEEYSDEAEIFVFGINNNGTLLKEKLLNELKKINSSIKFHSHQISLNPAHPTDHQIKTDIPLESLENKNLLIIDDVASTGRTLYYAAAHFNKILPRSIKIGVLVNRMHKSFPIEVNFMGRSLATTIHDDIQVDLKGNKNWSATLE